MIGANFAMEESDHPAKGARFRVCVLDSVVEGRIISGSLIEPGPSVNDGA
jgi:hypothetical protein